MTNHELITLLKQELIKHKQNPKVAHWILMYIYGCETHLEFISILNSPANKKEECIDALNDYLNNKPLSKILKTTSFYKDTFIVNDDVFSPRIETELLVDWLIKRQDHFANNIKVCDMCCGTGIIGLSLKKHWNKIIELTSIDLNPSAVQNTKENASLLKQNIKVVESDLFNKLDKDDKFDVIVCNPPYIDYKTNLYGVENYDPKLALFANNNGYEIYERMISSLRQRFINNDKFLIIFEIGLDQEQKIKQLLIEFDAQIQIIIEDDYNRINRFVIGYRGYEF